MTDNVVRDILCMSLRKKMDKFKAEPDKVREIGEKDFQKKKEQIWHSELSKLQTKLTES